jgi:pimeloyl-ACP methyl ester carboxylesterase
MYLYLAQPRRIGMIGTTIFSDHRVELSAGPIRYREAGTGTPVVFVHGFAVSGSLWEPVAARLAENGYRVIVPTWPFGSHAEAMKPEADLSPVAAAALVSEFLVALDLDGVTLVGNDSGGAVSQVVVTEHPERIARLVLTNCDCFDTFPPGVFKLMSKAARVPGMSYVLAQSMRFAPVLRAPFAFGALNSRRLPIDLLRSWVAPLIDDSAVRRDAMKFFGAASPQITRKAAEKLKRLRIPALIVWGADDTFFLPADARRLAETIPDATLVEIPNGKTFVALDQPDAVADAIASFLER